MASLGNMEDLSQCAIKKNSEDICFGNILFRFISIITFQKQFPSYVPPTSSSVLYQSAQHHNPMHRRVGHQTGGFVPSLPLSWQITQTVYQSSSSSWCNSRTRHSPVSRKRRHRCGNTPVARESRGRTPDPPIYDAIHLIPPMPDINFNPFDFAQLKGKVVYAVNVASQDNFTHDNYTLMAHLASSFKDEGLVILAFPSNWFGQKETWSSDKIKEFVENYNTDIVIMNKFDYEMNPVFALGQEYFPGEIVWNFHGKFLFGRDGIPLERFDLLAEDEEIVGKVRAACNGRVYDPEQAAEKSEETEYANMEEASL